MLKVVLVTNSMYKYREYVYQYFIDEFYKNNIEFKIIIAAKWNKKNEILSKDIVEYVGVNLFKLNEYLDKEKPNVVINFLHPSNISIWFLYLYTSVKKYRIFIGIMV